MRSWRWFLSRVMRLFLRWFRLCPRRGRRKRPSRLRDLWNYWRVLLKSLYYNVLTNSDTALDCVFEPIYWLVDNMTRWFGVVGGIPNRSCISVFQHPDPCSLFPGEGVCVSGDRLDQLRGDYRVSVCAAHHLQHVPRSLDPLAPLLRTLEPPHDPLPLL